MNKADLYLTLVEPFRYPLFAGIFSAFVCSLGVGQFLLSQSKTKYKNVSIGRSAFLEKSFSKNSRNLMYCIICSLAVTILVITLTESWTITFPFTLFAAIISWSILRNRSIRAAERLQEVWPEVTDHLISALHSGMSLSEALVGLSSRGPDILRAHFASFEAELIRTGDFSASVISLRDRFASHASDQIFEAIMLAKSLGGTELLQVFRTLGDFLRQDLVVRKEIEVKHGWIKNSAHLSAAAPWLLLLLLSTQPSTARAFNQPSGVIILLFGLLMTGIAYIWMGRLGKLPSSPRVFDGAKE